MVKCAFICFNPFMTGSAKPDRTPMMLSAFVYPGAGQFLQQRCIAGCIYAISFTLLFLLLTVEVVKPLFAYLNATLDWAAHAGMGNDTIPHRISLAWVS